VLYIIASPGPKDCKMQHQAPEFEAAHFFLGKSEN
jgi:hypothetical protein